MKIRSARPDDAPFLAKAILIAGRAHVKRGIWEVILDATEDETLAFLNHLSVTKIPHLFHHSHYLIAEDEAGNGLGNLGGYDPKTCGYPALQQAIPEVVRKLGLPSRADNGMYERAGRVMACMPKEIEGSWVIDSVATLPEHRGKGVAGNLLSAILEHGKSLGYTKAQVSMYTGNEPALNLYRKFGFQIYEEIQDAYFEEHIGSRGMLSLSREL